jgi:hypothetical protein
MRVFVAYGYHARDSWIGELIFDVIRAADLEPVDGKEVYGKSLTPAIQELIKNCDALIGFTTIRQEPVGSVGGTHRWVSDELVTASNYGVRFVEVREKGVEGGGMLDDSHARIDYQESQRDRCIVEIAKALHQWRRLSPVRIRLLPQEAAENIRPLRDKPGFRVTYRVLTGANESPAKETVLFPIAGGLYVRVSDLESTSLVSVLVEAGGKQWKSDYESVDSAVINLRE